MIWKRRRIRENLYPAAAIEKPCVLAGIERCCAGHTAFCYIIGNERDALGLNRKNPVFMRVSGVRSLIFLSWNPGSKKEGGRENGFQNGTQEQLVQRRHERYGDSMNQIMKVFENQHFKIDEGLFLPVRNIGSCVCHRPAVRKGGKPAVRK